MIGYHLAAMAQGKRSKSAGAGAGGGTTRKGSRKKKSADVIDVEAKPARVVDAGAAGVEAGSEREPEERDEEHEVGDLAADLAGPELEEVGDVDLVDVSLGSAPPADAGKGSIVRAERGVGRVDALTAYVQEIRRYPLLTREEEHDLAKKFVETQDPDIAKRLITANLRLVVKIAHEYRRAHRNLLDLIQEGNIGLMQAVRRYDPMRGVKLSSYAAWWIRAYILKFILNNWRMVKIGTTQAQRKLFFNLRKEKEKLEKLGFTPDFKLLAERLEVTEAEVAEMDQRLASSDASLDAPIGGNSDESDGRTRIDVLPDTAMRPDRAVEQQEFNSLLREKLEEFAAGLKGRDADLFRARWLSDEPRTLQEIGDEFGISRERARQLEKRLLDKLRDFLRKELGSAVDINAREE
jgi:RNA polymerase sigma-32 factor